MLSWRHLDLPELYLEPWANQCFFLWKYFLKLCQWKDVFAWKSAFLQDSCQLFYGQNCFTARDDSLVDDSIPFEMILSQNIYCRRGAWCNSVLRCLFYLIQFSSIQSLNHVRLFVTPWTARLPCPSLTLRVHPNPCPLSQWCHPTISCSVIPFSSCPQSFPASGSFPMSQLFS